MAGSQGAEGLMRGSRGAEGLVGVCGEAGLSAASCSCMAGLGVPPMWWVWSPGGTVGLGLVRFHMLASSRKDKYVLD